jgi:hypothetical protein
MFSFTGACFAVGGSGLGSGGAASPERVRLRMWAACCRRKTASESGGCVLASFSAPEGAVSEEVPEVVDPTGSGVCRLDGSEGQAISKGPPRLLSIAVRVETNVRGKRCGRRGAGHQALGLIQDERAQTGGMPAQ